MGITPWVYISRRNDGSGLTSVEAEYKSIKVKAVVKLFENSDTTMSAVRTFEEKTVQTGCHSIINDADKYASDPHLTLNYSILIQGLLQRMITK